MNRLTKRNEANTAYYYPKCFEKCDGLGASEKCNNCDLVHDACEKLGEYEDLEEQGLLLKLPCKVGDRLYKNDFLGFTISDTVHNIRIIQGNKVYLEMNYWYDDIPLSVIGKTVFLTQEQAEEALKKMRETE